MMNFKKIKIVLVVIFVGVYTAIASYNPEFSKAGFYNLEKSNREVYSMNNDWKLHKGDIEGAHQKNFDDSDWELVNLPNGIEYLPDNASGSVNYQGVVWYRKTAKYPSQLKGKKLFLHFEGIMGRSEIYINGKVLKKHFGGYLPAIVDVSEHIIPDEENVIAVMADNKDDISYPPGKSQLSLDFAYFGGIYRDVWLLSHNDVYISDPNYEDIVAGGGLFVSFDSVSEQKANMNLKLHLRNDSASDFIGKLKYKLTDLKGKTIKTLANDIKITKENASFFETSLTIKNPQTWSPEKPTLHYLDVVIEDENGKIVDGYRKRIGIRSIEFKGKEGFWLNGKKYSEALLGANRHQDFAVIGNALPNSLHWADAKKLRDLNFKIIRNAHYTQDPAFMDACDELGLFVIVATPGWQFWSHKPEFGQRVYSDIRNMVRRDRNHPSVIMWEPILNETPYPEDFAKNAYDCVMEEYPYKGAYPACDKSARGSQHYLINYGARNKESRDECTYFIREWGDNVDDWVAHNSLSRCDRNLGEEPMLKQANWYLRNANNLSKSAPNLLGGCLWHPFDHQRGYHPEPFFGGLMDIYRQPKTSYKVFETMRPIENTNPFAAKGAMVYIANEMTPFSPEDISVYTNCQEVRLQIYNDGEKITKKSIQEAKGAILPPVVFEKALKWSELRLQKDKKNIANAYIIAEGLIDGKVVATHKKVPTGKVDKLILWVDNNDMDLIADGSDKVVVVAGIVDNKGNIKRLDNSHSISFEVEGQGTLISNSECDIKAKKLSWGTAPIILQSTATAGEITIKANIAHKGVNQATGATLTIKSIPSKEKYLYDENLKSKTNAMKSKTQESKNTSELTEEIERLRKEISAMKMKETLETQKFFEDKNAVPSN